MITFEADASRVGRFTRSLAHALDAPMREPVLREATGESVERYMGGMRRRYAINSAGGGDWPDLAPSTKLARLRKAGLRYKREKGVTHADRLRMAAAVELPILIDSTTLISSLTPGSPGNFSEATSRTLRAGTNVRYGHWHQTGGTTPGRPPRRQIFVPPSPDLVDRMAGPLQSAVASISHYLVQQAISS